MSKKHKKKGKFGGVTLFEIEECKHPLKIKVGTHEVVLLSWTDFDLKTHEELISKLDVFIGLTSVGFKKYQNFKKIYQNPLLQYMAEQYHKHEETLNNLIVLEIDDGKINEGVFEIVKDLVKMKKKVGFGCYAGHGRTGWLLAKLIKYFEGVSGDEAVKKVRQKFCHKCVETDTQIEDLGCKKTRGYYSIKWEKWDKAKDKSAVDKWLEDAKKNKYSTKYYDPDDPNNYWGNRHEEEIPPSADPSEVEDEENQESQIPAPSFELREAYRKEGAGETLTEDEEQLIFADMAKYG